MRTITITILTALMACSMSMDAQTVITNNYGSNTGSGNTPSVSSNATATNPSSSDDDNPTGGIDVDYYGVEKGWGIGIEAHNGFLFGVMYTQGETNDVVTSNYAWGMHFGYNLRHWFSDAFYIEGRIGVGYADAKLEMTTYTTSTHTTEGRYLGKHYIEGKTYTTTNKSTTNLGGSDFYLMASPRIGLKVCKFNRGGGISIVGGYRWTFTKFKFDKDHTADHFSVGISILY